MSASKTEVSARRTSNGGAKRPPPTCSRCRRTYPPDFRMKRFVTEREGEPFLSHPVGEGDRPPRRSRRAGGGEGGPQAVRRPALSTTPSAGRGPPLPPAAGKEDHLRL